MLVLDYFCMNLMTINIIETFFDKSMIVDLFTLHRDNWLHLLYYKNGTLLCHGYTDHLAIDKST